MDLLIIATFLETTEKTIKTCADKGIGQYFLNTLFVSFGPWSCLCPSVYVHVCMLNMSAISLVSTRPELIEPSATEVHFWTLKTVDPLYEKALKAPGEN